MDFMESNIMGNTTLAAIRARLAATDKKQNKQFDNAVYPFWNIPNNGACTLRLLPDGDSSNDFFWVEKLVIKLPFPGVVGSNDGKSVLVAVPCVEMFPRNEYPKGCPILSEVRAWYKDPSMTETANKYWKKGTYITQGFVRESQLVEDKIPENPVRRFVLGKQIFNIMKAALLNPEIVNLPTDYENGTDFKISKTQKGPYADYATSSYSRKDTPLSSDELVAIEKYGLFNLSEFLPKKPTEKELEIIKEMFEASVDGQLYDPAKWGQYYKPAGMGDDVVTGDVANTTTTESATVKSQTTTTEAEAPAVDHVTTTPPESTSTGRSKAQDILSKIQNRTRTN
jgi:hypothetical protein